MVNVPRDRNATFQPEILERNRTLSNELEEKIVYLYAKGTSAMGSSGSWTTNLTNQCGRQSPRGRPHRPAV